MPKLREIGFTLFARGIAMFGPFGVSVITARVLGPEDRGRYFLILSLAQLAAQVSGLGLASSNTYLVASRRDLLSSLSVNSLYIAFIMAPICALCTAIFVNYPQIFGFSGASQGRLSAMIYFAVAIAPFVVAFIFLSNLVVAVGRIALFNALTVAYGLAALIAAGVAAIFGGRLVTFLTAAVCGPALVCLLSGFLLLRGLHVSAKFDLELLRRGFTYSAKAYLSVMMAFLMTRIGVIALQQQGDLAALGQYSIAVQISDALTLLPATIGLLLFPSLLRTEANDRWRVQWRAFWLLVGSMLAFLLTLSLLIPDIIPLVFGARYRPAVSLTLALFPSVLIVSATTINSQYLASEGYPWGQAMAWVVGAVAQTVLSFWLAPLYGAFGVIYALTVSSALVFLLILVEAFKNHARRRRQREAA